MCKKKLIEATENWLGNAQQTNGSLVDDLKKWGVSADQQQLILNQLNDEDEGFKLWPQHIKAWDAFMLVSTQFTVAPNGKVLGMNYPAMESGFRMAGLTVDAGLFEKLRVIEQAMVSHLAK